MNAQTTIPMTSRRRDLFTPPSIVGKPNEVTLELRVATPSERDTIGTKLYQMGIAPVEESLIRATMIDELYETDWGKGSKEANEAYADELAQRVESFWYQTSLEAQAVGEWAERELERLRDERAEGVKRDPEPRPTGFIAPRERAKVTIITDRMNRESARIRDLMARRLDYGKSNDRMLCRIHILSMDATKRDAAARALEFGQDGLLTEESLDDIREIIGDQGYRELVLRIDGQYKLPETERKNSDSPPESSSSPNGSTEAPDASESSDGSSTE